MGSTTIPGAVSALVALAEGLTLSKSPDGVAVKVSDGFPGPAVPLDVLTIGGSIHPTVDGSQGWANLGAQQVDETYDVNCYVQCERTVSQDGSSAQAAARAAAFAIFEAFQAAHRADIRLGGILLWSTITKVVATQTDESNSANGRICQIEFSVQCRARI